MKYRHALALLSLLFLPAACSVDVPTPEEMVRERIEEGREYAARRETSELLGMLTDDFTATRGIDKQNLPAWMARFYLTTKSPQVFVRIREVTADWQTAKATLLMGTTNFSLSELNFDNFRGRLLHMEIHMRFVDDETWMINRVDWRDAKREDLTIF
jgi:hypothetical protein